LDVRDGCNDAIRETWGRNSKIPYKIVLGERHADYGHRNKVEYGDELIVPAADTLLFLSHKRRDSIRWALKAGYTHCFCCCRDTYINTQRLLDSDFALADYIGNSLDTAGKPSHFAGGGPGYWVSERAMGILAAADIVPTPTDPGMGQNEDTWVGRTLGHSGINLELDTRYSSGCSYEFQEEQVLATNNNISCHLSHGPREYDKRWMYDAYLADMSHE
jgi:hypothetical protein